jgi:hypothetical protein
MAVSDAKWDGSSANYKDANAYCAACLIDTNEGGEKIAGACKLPVKEPGGAINRNAVHNAAARFDQLNDVPADKKAAAARKLVSIYKNDLKETPPDSVLKAAGLSTSKQVSDNIRKRAGKLK